MSELRFKEKIACNTCGDLRLRVKTIKVVSTVKEEAIKEAKTAIERWKEKIVKKNCNICQSILDDIKKEKEGAINEYE